jgi:glycerol uptake facilitator-like aquaporin
VIRKAIAEFLGTCTLVAVVVGSGTMATLMSADRGVELLINTFSTIFALAILILVLGPISGAHFNPAVTLSELAQKRISDIESFAFLAAQFSGGVLGTIIANLMFKNPAIFQSHHVRSGANLWFGEVIATAGLLFLIQLLRNQNKLALAPVVLAGWIGSAYLSTSSTSFANPAVTVARGFTNTFSGIAPSSILGFIVAQLIGAALGTTLGNYLSNRPKESSRE